MKRQSISVELDSTSIIGTKAKITSYGLFKNSTEEYICIGYENTKGGIWINRENGNFATNEISDKINKVANRRVNGRINELNSIIEKLNKLNFNRIKSN